MTTNLTLPTIDLNSPNWNVLLSYSFSLVGDKLDEMAAGIQGSADSPFTKLVNNDSVVAAMALTDTRTDDNVNDRMRSCEDPKLVKSF